MDNKLKRNLLACLAFIATMTVHAQGPETVYRPEGTKFTLLAPPDTRPVLRIYKEGLGGKPLKTIKMTRDTDKPSHWTAYLKGDQKGRFYTFDISGDKRNPRETPGIFARAVGVNGKRAAIVDMRETCPEGWEWDAQLTTDSPADLVIYEMHHRDFSVGRNLGTPLRDGERTGKRVACQYPGKFLALTEPWAIAHLQELGINAVHILPSFDYASVDETRLDEPQYNWGYDPVNYNVPEGSYSTDPYNPVVRIREFKQMVQALHNAGIRVILDVVYNHTFDIDGSAFQRTYPDYFYRKNADGTYSNGSGCGNETASDQDFMRMYMIESVKYWMEEYHIDGFRFDLMGIHDIYTMNAIQRVARSVNRNVFIYGEGWSAGSCAYPYEKLAMKAHIKQMPGIAAFSDDIRDALRGPFSDDTKGAFLAGIAGEEESLKAGIVGMIDHPQVDYSKVNYAKEPWANEPTQMISYVSCHDDMCLVDRLKTELPGIGEDELIRLDLLAQTAVFTSQGVPFMLSGEEMLRDKKGVHNSFNSPDSINILPWDNLKRYPQVFNYYKGLIALRKAHPAFRLGSADLVRKHLEFLTPASPLGGIEGGLVAFRLKDHAGGDKWQDIIVVLNANREAIHLDIPEGRWTIVCCDGVISLDEAEGLGQLSGGTIAVDPQSALILHN